MVGRNFEVDDLVWAKMKGFPPWPARIAEPQDPKSSSVKKQQHFVYFYGTHNYAWISDENITPHSEQMIKNSEGYKKKPAKLRMAVEELEEESKEAELTPKQPVEMTTSEKQQPQKTSKRPASKAPIQKKSSKKRKTSLSEEDIEFDFFDFTHRMIEESPSLGGAGDINFLARIIEEPTNTVGSNFKNKRKRKRTVPERKYSSDSSDYEDEDCSKIVIDQSKFAHLLENMATPSYEFSRVTFPSFDDDPWVSLLQPKSIIDRPYIPRPPTPPLDVSTPHKNLVGKKIKATTKKIGFLGLGMMGRGMVKNLLNSHHDVTIWNRTREKCDIFVKAGAKVGDTPSDVVAACDIIFCCVSDSATAKRLVFGSCGVLRGFNESQMGKAYVEMTSVDPETSIEIAEAVFNKGGRYLEAPVVGSRKKAEEGSLLVLGYGDQALFNECESCFSAMAKNAYYFGCDIGSGAKINLIQSMLTGSIYASLAESMALVDSCNLQVDTFLDVLRQSSLSCELIVDKAEAMKNSNYETNTALKHQKKNLDMALRLGNQMSQPLDMAAMANEIFKRAMMRRYYDHDVAAVKKGAEV